MDDIAQLIVYILSEQREKISGERGPDTEKMSWHSKVFLTTCCATTIGIITYVHLKQNWDREQLHMGVIRDIERQERRRAENIYRLQQQIGLTEELRTNNPNSLDKT